MDDIEAQGAKTGCGDRTSDDSVSGVSCQGPDAGVSVGRLPERAHRVTMRPPYRRGGDYVRCGVRIPRPVWSALHREARRRRIWVSVLAQQLLVQGLGTTAAMEGNDGAAAHDYGGQPAARHWMRVVIEQPQWDILHRAAQEAGLSVPQLVRQQIGKMVDHTPVTMTGV